MEPVKKYSPYIVSFAVFIIYLSTLAPSVLQIDTGELAAVQAIAGVAHPTGYPLFTMLGYLFLQIPLPFSKIFQANLLSAIYCSLSIAFIIKSVSLFFSVSLAPKTAAVKSRKGGKAAPAVQVTFTEAERTAASIFTAFVIALNSTYWMQSTSTEVYSLQALLFSVILFAAARFLAADNPGKKECFFLAGAAALGFTNHMTTLLIIPGLIYLYFAKMGFGKESLKKIPSMLILSAGIIAAVYSYLFICAGQNPPLNWGDTTSLENFFRHLSGKQYQVWLFSSVEEAKKQLSLYISELPSVFAYLPLLFSAAGLIFLYNQNRRLFHFLLITYIFGVLYTINYSIHDIESYFLLSHVILGIYTGFGALRIMQFLKARSIDFAASAGALGLIAAVMFTLNFGKVNSKGIYVFEDYTKAALGALPQNSILFSYQWDYLVSPAYYFQMVEKYRNDISVIDKELLRRSWYFKQIDRNHPGMLAGVKSEVNSFIQELRIFERGGKYNSERLEYFYQSIMTLLITTNIGKREYFIGPELIDNELRNGQFKLPPGSAAVPYGLFYKVTMNNEYVPGPDINFQIRFPEEMNTYSSYIYQQTAGMLLRRAQYELQYGMKEKAKAIVEKVRKEFPDISVPDFILKEI